MHRIVTGFLCSLVILTLVASGLMAAEINLSAAASMKEAVRGLTDGFAKKNPGVTFRINMASSGALAKQIMNGAPCDVYFSANLDWMNHLEEKKLVDKENVAVLAFNEIVFVGKPDLKVKGMNDVPSLERIAIGSPKSVPAGQYAAQAIRKAGLDAKLEKKLVMARDVRECLMYAERGEVNGAFVYRTDAEQMAKNVKILFTVPQELYSRVTYPMALTETGSKKAEAIAFFKYLRSPEAKIVLTKYGFMVK